MMNDEENVSHKLDSPERKLRLKKVYKESANKADIPNDSNNKDQKNDIASTSQSVCNDDSMLDFKSPKRIHPMQPNNINRNRLLNKTKKKISHAKIKIIKDEKEHKSNKLLGNKKLIHDTQQTSIESSFFKTEKKTEPPQSSSNIKTAYVCPLCFKSLKDEDSQAMHTKNCAVKNNISTKKLLDAMELQERQAAERKSLGLLSAPILQEKKKPVSHKMTSHDDPDLQLALALSKSLYEKEEMEIWNAAEIVPISSNSSLPDNNKEYSNSQKTTLQTFGFTCSTSPTHDYPNKIKRKKPIEPTVLQKRTSAERESILTERIAEILMGCKDFTQKLQEENKQSNNIKHRTIIKSQLLQQLHQTENTLWNRTRLTPNQNMFYVKQLSPQITLLKEEQKLNKEQNFIKLAEQDIKNEKYLDKKEVITEEKKEIQIVSITNDSKELMTNSSKTYNACCEEKRFLDTLAISWGNILNDSSASDIIVLVKDSKHIWTHKLVFYVRCTDILLDITSNDTRFSNIKEKICWFDVDYNSALAFLEFIYSGIINKYSKILDSNTSLSTIRSLARKYKINDLFAYLRQKELEYNIPKVKYDHNISGSIQNHKVTEDICANMEITSEASKLDKITFNTSPNHVYNKLENICCSQKELLKENINDVLPSLEDDYVTVEDLHSIQSKKDVSMSSLEQLNSKDNTPTNREINTSLDMFDDTTSVINNHNKSTMYSKDQEDSGIHILLNLIKQDQEFHNTEYSKGNESVSICLQNVEENVMETTQIDLDCHLDLKPSMNNLQKNSFNIIQKNNPEITQDHLSEAAKQEDNLALFIEKIQNANSDTDLDSDLDITTHPAQMSSINYLNPFHKKKHDNSDNENSISYSDNIQLSTNPEKKIGRLTIIEQDMQTYANKNPEFYFCLSNKNLQDSKQNTTKHMSITSSRITKSSHNNTHNYTQNFISPTKKDINVSEQMINSPLSVLSSKTHQSSSDSETDEKEISMYSEYMRNHKDNSIAKYRPAIEKNKSDSNLSNKSTLFDSIHENNDEDNEVLTKSIITQKDTDIIVSPNSDIKNISSSINSLATLQNDDSDTSHSMQSGKTIEITECNEQVGENERSQQILQKEQISKAVMADSEIEKNVNCIIKFNGYQSDTNDTEIILDDTEFGMNFSQTKSQLDDWDENKINDKKKFTPSPIMLSSSPDILHMENLLPDMEHNNKNVIIENSDNLKKTAKSFFNFEDNIYLANVDLDEYEKPCASEKNQPSNVLNTTASKKSNVCKYNNGSNKKYRGTDTIASNIGLDRENVDRTAMLLSHNSTAIRKFKKKSLSEGQIRCNASRIQRTSSFNVPIQSQFNSAQNIGDIMTNPKIIDKDITPPPNYDGMRTPELHKEMKKYGLKAQKRSRAVKLLTHIYDKLHPLVPVKQTITEVSSEDENPPRKKQDTGDNKLEKLNNVKDNDDELVYLQDSNDMEFYETQQLSTEVELENLSNIREAFTKLVNLDKDLYKKILQYEPVNIEKLQSVLWIQCGFKCKISDLISFLDEQCITFYATERNGNKTRRKVS